MFHGRIFTTRLYTQSPSHFLWRSFDDCYGLIAAKAVSGLPKDFNVKRTEHMKNFISVILGPKNHLMQQLIIFRTYTGSLDGVNRGTEKLMSSMPSLALWQRDIRDQMYRGIAQAQEDIGNLVAAKRIAQKIADKDMRLSQRDLDPSSSQGRCGASTVSVATWEDLADSLQDHMRFGVGWDVGNPVGGGLAKSDLYKFLERIKTKNAADSALEIMDAMRQLSIALARVRSCENAGTSNKSK